ncbi:MAG: hypothetical protein ABI649_07785 [Gaiellaceae bacterium]
MAALAATWPAIGSFDSAFMASGGDGYGEPPAGDHLQTVYRFWLVGHQLGQGAAPWKDPYSFQPLVEHQTVLGAWPFGLAFWPLDALFGPVIAWNLLLLATVVAAGLLTYAWLRSIGLETWGAAVGGLAFAVAPYRLDQSASGHVLGWAALFLPLSLLAIERSRAATTPGRAHAWGALSAAGVASIALAGQLHLALGAVPFLLAYAVLRRRPVALAWTAGGALVAAVTGLVVRYTLIAGSPEDAGRSLTDVRRFEAEWPDFLNRWHRPGSEEFVYIGWLTPLLALAGLVLLARKRRGLALLLGLGALLPILLALGTNLPTYSALWHAFPPLRFPRVPERFMPIANLALAALVAYAVAEAVRRAGRRAAPVAGALLLLVALDLGAQPVSATAADPANGAYARLSGPGRTLELPLFDPSIHFGSVYDYYELQSRRERPAGYNSLAPKQAHEFALTYGRLSCGVWLPGDRAALADLGVGRILFHSGVYRQSKDASAWFAWRGLTEAGWQPLARGGAVTLFAPGSSSSAPAFAEPPRTQPVLCSGWSDRAMTERQAALWLFGTGPFDLRVAAEASTHLLVSAEGSVLFDREVLGPSTVRVRFDDAAWHALVFDASRPGLRLD